MQRILSTYLFVRRKLGPPIIEAAAGAGFAAIEVFCARGHFDYQSSGEARALGAWLDAHGLALHALHAPTQRDQGPSRESGSPISISDPERVRRLEAVDEIKRALDVAECAPFRFLVLHVATSREPDEPRRWDAAFNSIEHLALFAKQRGVTIALENTPGELPTPENLRRFLEQTRLTDVRFCFDVGHAHMGGGIAVALESMRDRIVTAHMHDNHGEKDEHLPPFDGTVDWPATLVALPAETPLVLELRAPEIALGSEPPEPAALLKSGRAALDRLEQAQPTARA
ncbi:MAG: sugar phosphate isomerase/epimerase family protein [Candidatus Acidiferrales bacterium]